MNIKPFLPYVQTAECKQFAFFGMAYELTKAKRMFSYGTPADRRDRDRGISICITHAGGHDYLELCILSMGYTPITECGPVRAVIFPTVAAKDAFKKEFSAFYESTLTYLPSMKGIAPDDFYRFVYYPRVIETINGVSSHAVVLSINLVFQVESEESINEESSTGELGNPLNPKPGTIEEPARTLWIEHIKQVSEFIWEDSKQFDDIDNWQRMQITFRSRRSRDRYVRYVDSLDAAFDQFSIDKFENPIDPVFGLLLNRWYYSPGFPGNNFPLRKPFGPLGLSDKNPIQMRSIPDSNQYLSRIITHQGIPVTWKRVGSTTAPEFTDKVIDIYSISNDTQEIAVLYICPYHDINTDQAPTGFLLVK